MKIALCGNPNVGKSTVFNALTGLRQHTGNWAGKTVETSVGLVRYGEEIWEVIDLPGAYSLYGGSPEEIAASDYLTFEHSDLIVVVCDALCLERNLNLAIQLGCLYSKMLLCINMMDEADKNSLIINTKRIEKMTGIPVVGISAKSRKSLHQLKEAIYCLLSQKHSDAPISSCLSEMYLSMYERLYEALRDIVPDRFHLPLVTFRILAEGVPFVEKLSSKLPSEQRNSVASCITSIVKTDSFSSKQFSKEIIQSTYHQAEEICRVSLQEPSCNHHEKNQLTIDKILSSKALGIPLMVCMLMLILYLTISGANIPSAILSRCFSAAEPVLKSIFSTLQAPTWLSGMLIDGAYRVTSWIVSVMLPPMAIFFPLFTLMEEIGLLPRIAFQLDRCFCRCCACGKQALCMCMGLGCNAVGVTGARIIQSPRERMIAILTNSLVPCNGRFPALIALISLFFSGGSAVLGAFVLTAALLLSILITLVWSKLLSKTVLQGIASAFVLELPTFRKPKIGEIVVRSIFDRTLFVMGRAICVAVPAGLIIWLLGNIDLGNVTLLSALAAWLEPMGSLLGMDGVILLAFIIGLPANELILPAMMMIYLKQRALVPLDGLETLHYLLTSNGWTLWTAACTVVFTLFHWPCSTTLLTIHKETKSVKWTALAFLLPALSGILICMAIKTVSLLFI